MAETCLHDAEPGACEGHVICGPSGDFTCPVFRTIAGVDFTRFPANPPRGADVPYQPGQGHVTLHVATTGSDLASGTEAAPLKTLAHAVELAQGGTPRGDVILVHDGTYPLTPGDTEYGLLLPDDKPGLVLAAQHVGGAELIPATPDVRYGMWASADGLVVDGFVFRGFAHGGQSGGTVIQFGRETTQHGLVLKHVVIDDGDVPLAERGVGTDAIRSFYVARGSCCLPGGDSCFEGSPEECTQAGGTYFSNAHCEYGECGDIHGCGTAASHQAVPVVSGFLLRDVWIRDHLGIGFNCGEGPCDDVRFDGVRMELVPSDTESSGADALAFEAGTNVVVFNADISGSEADGIDTKAANAAIVNTVVHDVGRNGIKIWRGGDIVNSVCFNTGADGAVIFDLGGAYRILHSLFARHLPCFRCTEQDCACVSYQGTVDYQPECWSYLRTAGALTIANSVFYDNPGALYVQPRFTLSVRNTDFFSPRSGEYLAWRGASFQPAPGPEDEAVTYGDGDGLHPASELAPNGCSPCSGVMFGVDSQPLDATDGPFTSSKARWQAGSPAVDAGDADIASAPSFDLLGAARASGAAPDLGPFEQQVGGGGPDSDGDGVPDATDDCADVPDPGQVDADSDGIGDACDIPSGPCDHATGDLNLDGHVAVADLVAMLHELKAQAPPDCAADVHVDGRLDRQDLGDLLSSVLHAPPSLGVDDGDTVPSDGDGDGTPGDHPCTNGVTTGCDDNCPSAANQDQADADGDTEGDACDPCADDAADDSDGDGICVGARFLAPKTGGSDNCPTLSNPTQADSDHDGTGDACELSIVETSCANGLDEDGDHLQDCGDPDCDADPHCMVPYGGTLPAADTFAPNEVQYATMTVAGLERPVATYVPQSRGAHPPLVIMFACTDCDSPDGPNASLFGSNSVGALAGDRETCVGDPGLAESEGVVFISPLTRLMSVGDWDHHEADQYYWETCAGRDAGTCRAQNPDLLLVRAIIREAEIRYDVDRARIYTLGFSSGAFFAETAALALRDQVAAFAESGGGLVTVPSTQDCSSQCDACAAPFSCMAVRSAQDSPESCSGTDGEKPIAIPTSGRLVPGFLAHAVNDDVVPAAHDCNLDDRLAQLGYAVELHLRKEPAGAERHQVPCDFANQAWPFLSAHPMGP
jgi:poly(3-hydroxybutyrate) depolymerase